MDNKDNQSAVRERTTESMTTYSVQFTMPVDNPGNNVRVTKRKGSYSFEVPLNHQDAHNMGLMDLLAAAELSGLLGLPAHLNNKKLDLKAK